MAGVVMPTSKSGAQAPVHEGGYKGIVYLICIIAALGGLLFGLDQGFISNALPTIKGHYGLSTIQAESYSAILAWGGIVGALLSGLFARFLGRKKSLVFAGFLFSACTVGSALLPAMPIFTGLRFFLGFAVGMASFVVPLYLSETAPAKIRGAMGTLFQLLITIGIFVIAVSNMIIASIIKDHSIALPVMFLVVAIFALVMFFGSFILPESPRWLMLKGRKEEAIKNLTKTLSNQAEVDFEIKEIEANLTGPKGTQIAINLFIKVLIVGVVLQMFQQLVGINVMIYYAPVIFGCAGVSGLLAALTVPTVNMIFTFPAIKLVEKWGRKKLLYVGAVCMLITMVAAGSAFFPIEKLMAPANKAMTEYFNDKGQTPGKLLTTIAEVKKDGFNELASFLSDPKNQAIEKDDPAQFKDKVRDAIVADIKPSVSGGVKVIVVIAIIIYIFGFAVSWGPVAWLVCSEIFPIKNREVGMTVTTMVNWLFAGLCMQFALTFMNTFGVPALFYLFAAFCILSMIFVKFFVPETKGITLEEFEANLKAGKPLRKLGEF